MYQMVMAAAQVANGVGAAFTSEAMRKLQAQMAARQDALNKRIAQANADAENKFREAHNMQVASATYLAGIEGSLRVSNQLDKLGQAHDAAVRTAARLSENATSKGISRALSELENAGALSARMALAGAGSASAMLTSTMERQNLYRKALAEETSRVQNWEARNQVGGATAAYLTPEVLNINAVLNQSESVAAFTHSTTLGLGSSNLFGNIGQAFAANIPAFMKDLGETLRTGGAPVSWQASSVDLGTNIANNPFDLHLTTQTPSTFSGAVNGNLLFGY